MQNPHGIGGLGGNLLVPPEYSAAQPCVAMPDEARRTLCGMIRLVDECVEKSVRMMRELLDPNLLLVMIADNGGSAQGGGYNMPLRVTT